MVTYLCPHTSDTDKLVYSVVIITVVLLCGVFVWSCRIAYKMRHLFFLETFGAFYYGPIVIVLLMFYTIGSGIPYVDGLTSETKLVVYAMLIVKAFIPFLVVIKLFELSAVLHRNRCVNFCCIVKFEEFNTKRATRRLQMARIVVYSVSFVGLVLVLVSNSLMIAHNTLPVNSSLALCSQGVFVSYIFPESNSNMLWTSTSFEIFADVYQPLLMTAFLMYFGFLLYCYGMHYSFTIYSTCFNPWVFIAVISLLMVLGMFVRTNGVLQSITFFLIALANTLVAQLTQKEILFHNEQVKYLSESGAIVSKNVGSFRSATSNTMREGDINNDQPEDVQLDEIVDPRSASPVSEIYRSDVANEEHVQHYSGDVTPSNDHDEGSVEDVHTTKLHVAVI